MREIVLDTESTGLDPFQGHRVVEIGCVELINGLPSGAVFQTYINPERDMPEGAFKVHGLSEKFLQDFPLFKDISLEFLAFIGSDPLVIHNATFDMKFLNAELKWADLKPIEDNQIIDTLLMARKKFPGSPASLDALCRRFDIDNTHREKHGALLDAEILAEVYLELMGGRQKGLFIGTGPSESPALEMGYAFSKKMFPKRSFVATKEEQAQHKVFLKEIKNPIWCDS